MKGRLVDVVITSRSARVVESTQTGDLVVVRRREVVDAPDASAIQRLEHDKGPAAEVVGECLEGFSQRSVGQTRMARSKGCFRNKDLEATALHHRSVLD